MTSQIASNVNRMTFGGAVGSRLEIRPGGGSMWEEWSVGSDGVVVLVYEPAAKQAEG
jgi:hypothetical protein